MLHKHLTTKYNWYSNWHKHQHHHHHFHWLIFMVVFLISASLISTTWQLALDDENRLIVSVAEVKAQIGSVYYYVDEIVVIPRPLWRIFSIARAVIRVRDTSGNPVPGVTINTHWTGITFDNDIIILM